MQVLTICSEANRHIAEMAMADWSLKLRCCSRIHEATSTLHDARFLVVLCDETLPDGTYRDVLKLLGHKLCHTRVVVMSSASDLDDFYREAQPLGAFDVIASPCRRTEVQWIVIRAVREPLRVRPPSVQAAARVAEDQNDPNPLT